MKFSTLCLHIIGLGGTAATASSSSSVPSSQPSLSLMPSFVPTHPGMASGQQFTKVGPGRCRDSAGQSYSFVLGDVFSMDEPQSCYDWCTQANEEKLVGFDLYNIFCFCLLDRNHDAKLADYKDPSPRSGILDAQGEGDIGGLSTQTSYDCYQIEVSQFCLEKTLCCEIYNSPSCDLTIILCYSDRTLYLSLQVCLQASRHCL